MKSQRIASMEGLRGCAVTLVFLVHFASGLLPYVAEASFSYTLLSALHSAGNVGVDLFFVISGFLIYPLVLRPDFSFLPFFARRIQRIYPTFLAVLLLYLMLSFVLGSHSKLPDGWQAASIYIAQNVLLLPGIFAIEPIITVAWSLSYELLFYCSLPLLFLMLPLREMSYRSRQLFFLLLALLGFSVCLGWGGPIRMLMFVAGMLVSDQLRGSKVSLPANWGGGLMLIGLVGLLLYPTFGLPGDYKYPVLFVVLGIFCWECFAERSTTAGLMAWPPLRWLGNRSYSYYLIHGLALQGAFLLLKWALPAGTQWSWLPWALLIPAFAITLIPSVLLFKWVEQPLSFQKGR